MYITYYHILITVNISNNYLTCDCNNYLHYIACRNIDFLIFTTFGGKFAFCSTPNVRNNVMLTLRWFYEMILSFGQGKAWIMCSWEKHFNIHKKVNNLWKTIAYNDVAYVLYIFSTLKLTTVFLQYKYSTLISWRLRIVFLKLYLVLNIIWRRTFYILSTVCFILCNLKYSR